MPKEVEILTDFLKEKNLKLTSQRRTILEAFLKTEKHVSVDDLYDIIRKNSPDIGHATVFRTLRLFRNADIAKEVDLGDKRTRYEHKYGHNHHDHLICVQCGKFIEVLDEEIEKLQDKFCKRAGFLPQRHKMEIFGICRQCRAKEKR
ncbi:MAG: transcriptional repressor [Candidatus Omnitrophota bacterium]